MPKWDAWMAGLADVLGPLLLTVPPTIGSRKPKDLLDTLRLAWQQRGLNVRTIADVTRLMTMSIADLLDDWFESWQVKAPIAVNGVIGTWAGPCEPGTAYVMAHHSIGDIGDGHLGNWGFPEGGMGGVAAAIERSARSFGAEIRTDAKVARTLITGGRVRGVVLESGEEILAPVVVTTLHPRTAFLDHVGSSQLPDDFVTDIERWKTRSGVVKINLALSELPNFTADPGVEQAEHHTGSVEMGPSIEYMERAFQDAREGRGATRPFADGVIPTTFDKTLCPEGTHIMSLFTQWVPSEWSETPHQPRTWRPTPTGWSTATTRWLPTSRPRSFTATSSAPTRWSTSTASSGATSSMVSSPWSSSSTCVPPPATPTTGPPSRVSTTADRPPMPVAASAAFPVGRRPRRSWPTSRPEQGLGPEAAAGAPPPGGDPAGPGAHRPRRSRRPGHARGPAGGRGGGQRHGRAASAYGW